MTRWQSAPGDDPGRPDGPPGDDENGPGDGDSAVAPGPDPDQGADGPVDAELAELLEGIVAGADTEASRLSAERDEYLAALQRNQADFENYRKRVDRQQKEQADRAALHLVGKLLPVLDTLDLAQAHLGPTGDGEEADAPSAETQALTQARAQLVDALTREGLERVDEAEVEFDPSVHDAVAHAPADGEDATTATVVDEVLRAGYRWRGQVLRPAMVRVRG